VRVCFWCPSAERATGYGYVHVRLWKALREIGVDLTDDPERADVEVYYGLPSSSPLHCRLWRERHSDVFVFYTMFEVVPIPPDWVDVIMGRNPSARAADAVFVPSAWCKEAFRGSGVSCPIYVVPHGVDPQEFPFIKRPEQTPLTAIWQGANPNDRKGRTIVERAIRGTGINLIEKWIPARNQYSEGGPGAKIWRIGKKLSRPEMLEILGHADISVNPTGGEGFGLIPLEHAATGLPVILTGWSGENEYADAIHARRLEYTVAPSTYGAHFGTQGVGAIADAGDLRAALLEFRDDPGRAGRIGTLAAVGSTRFSWAAAARAFALATEGVLEGIGRGGSRSSSHGAIMQPSIT